MTSGKYKRLFIVVSLPLLLFGFFLSTVVIPFPRLVEIRCDGGEDYSNCGNSIRNPHRFREEMEHITRFTVEGPLSEDWIIHYWVAADAIVLRRVTVDNVTLNEGMGYPPEVEAAARQMLGRTAVMFLGIEDGMRSFDNGNEIFLWCHTLEYDMEPTSWLSQPGPYTATCTGDDWEGHVSFTPSQEALRSLTPLRSAVSDEVGGIEVEFWVHSIAVTLAPVVVFLILSAIVWMTRRAAMFVRAG